MAGIFEFSIPSHLKFGIDVINRLGNIVNEYGDKVLIVTEAILHESGVIKRVVEILQKKGCEAIVFDEVIPNANSKIVELGVDLARSSYTEVVIGLGGVKTLSIAKAIASNSKGYKDIYEFIDNSSYNTEPLPYIEIPSTSRNPFMFRDEFLITDARTNDAKILKTKRNTTKSILFDPMITTTLPRRYTGATTIDALANSIEGFFSTRSNFLSDTIFLKAIELFSSNIMNAVNVQDDITSRANLSLGGLFSSIGLSMSETGITSGLSYVLNAKYKIPNL